MCDVDIFGTISGAFVVLCCCFTMPKIYRFGFMPFFYQAFDFPLLDYVSCF